MPTLRPTRDMLIPRVPNLDDDELQKLVGEQAQGLQGLLNELRTRLTSVEENDSLSAAGKRERRQEIVRELREAAQNIGRVDRAERLRERVQSAREHLFDQDVRLADEEE